MSGEAVLDVTGLETRFGTPDGVVHAVNGVSFELRAGEFLGVVGESGSGKSVTMMSLLKLIPMPPGEIPNGSAEFEDADLLELSPSELRKVRGGQVGFIFQDPMTSLNPVLTIGKQLSEPVMLHTGASRKEAKVRAIELLDLVGVPEPRRRASQYPHEFSGGMRQRAMIAMALVCNPKILIADEPTTALDVTIEAQILELLESIKSEFNMSMIYISHDLAVIGEISDRILVMYLGRVVESGVADEVIDNPLHPYTRALLKSIPKIDQPIESLEPIEGSIPSPFEVHTGCPFYSRCTERLGEICLRQKPDNKTYNNGHTVSCHLHA